MGDSASYAVLTGDLIKSTDLSVPELTAVRDTVSDSVRSVTKWRDTIVKGQSEFFQGDAWQLLIAEPRFALRVAVFIRARLRAKCDQDTRIAIGLGDVTSINEQRISLSIGTAFERSGRALANMNLYSSLTIATSDLPVEPWLPVVGHLVDALINEWTQKQAETVSVALTPKAFRETSGSRPVEDLNHEEIGQKLDPPSAKQTVSRALKSAQFHAIQAAIRQFEATNWQGQPETQ